MKIRITITFLAVLVSVMSQSFNSIVWSSSTLSQISMNRTLSDIAATPDQDVTITLSIKFDSLSNSARGLYITDNIPDSLVGSFTIISVELGGINITNTVTIEQDSSGSIYEGATPIRWILETPPWFTENLAANANDSVVVKYMITIPTNAPDSTMYSFPNALWVTVIDPLGTPSYEFGYEDYPNPTIRVVISNKVDLRYRLDPNKYFLSQNYPNPFNPSTLISYSLPKSDHVILKIYDMRGREVKTLVNKFQKANIYTVKFEANAFSSGIYFYKLQVGNNFVETKKMLLMR